MRTKTLGNPIAVALVATKAADALPFIIKSVFVAGGLYYVYCKYTNRFVSLSEDNSLPRANVTIAQAQMSAEAIYNAISFFNFNFEKVADQIKGLNYNGFIRVYNAFGQRKPTILGKEMDLESWARYQFPNRYNELSFLMGGVFFK